MLGKLEKAAVAAVAVLAVSVAPATLAAPVVKQLADNVYI